MVSFKVCVLLSCVVAASLVQPSLADAPKLQYEEMSQQVMESLKKAAKPFADMIGYDAEKREKYIAEFKNLVQKVQDSLKECLIKLEKDLEPYTKEVRKSLDKAIDQTTDFLKRLEDPEIRSKAHKIVDTWLMAMKKITEQLAELGKSLNVPISDKTVSFVQGFFEDVVKSERIIEDKMKEHLDTVIAEARKLKSKN